MNDIKKRQHYVWRHYLKPWTDGESIWTYLKEQDKIVKPGLMGVAQEKYFYGLEDFSDEEINFLKKFVDTTSPLVLKGLNSDFLTLFTSTSVLKRQLAANTNPKVNTGFLVQDFYTTGQKYTNEFMITQSDWLGMVDMPTDCKVPVEGSLIYYSKKGKKQAIYRFKNSRYYSGWNSKCD